MLQTREESDMTKIVCDADIALNTERKAGKKVSMLAIGKALTDSKIGKFRDQAEVGIYDVDSMISIKGQFAIHEDYEQTQVNKVCPWTFLQVAWNKMNQQTRNACIQEVQKMLRDDIKPDVKELKAVTKAAVGAVKKDVKQISRGPCKFNGTIWVTD